ncbi:MAG: hypothetical protein LBL46_04145 [Rickettsiales bacterium]|jgi:tRNA (guanine-N7-)-methyltransferase|nr:hypothetical protein [Rickettsiales bacterium]
MEKTENQFIRTFGRVHGKSLSARQQHLVDKLLPSLLPSPSPNPSPILEIGFGAGEHIIELAEANPDKIIIGAEPFINGVASLLSRIADDEGKILPQYKNIRIWPDDIRKMPAAGPFSEIWILHPDPWPKARHEKRRLLSADFIKTLWSLICKDGKISIGTDHADYFDWILLQIKSAGLKISAEKMPPVKTRYQEKDMFGAGVTRYIVIKK